MEVLIDDENNDKEGRFAIQYCHKNAYKSQLSICELIEIEKKVLPLQPKVARCETKSLIDKATNSNNTISDTHICT